MNDRRRFLHVLGATTAAVALPACGGTDTTTSGTGTSGAGGAGGAGGSGSTATTGGMGGAGGSGATASSTASSSASTGGNNCEMNPVGALVGVPADFATNGLHIVAGSKVLVGRDDQGLYALTSICPHEFCDMDSKQGGQPVGTVTAQGITCNCHNSKFDALGNALSGPVHQMEISQNKKFPLKPYLMVLGCDGKLYVDKSKVVKITDRVVA